MRISKKPQLTQLEYRRAYRELQSELAECVLLRVGAASRKVQPEKHAVLGWKRSREVQECRRLQYSWRESFDQGPISNHVLCLNRQAYCGG